MQQKITVPGFIFKPVMSKKMTTMEVKRQDDKLEIEFPVFDKDDVLKAAEALNLRKYSAHDRSIEDTIDIIDQVGQLWFNHNYDLRKETLDVIPMITGQSRNLCEIELDAVLQLWQRKTAELMLSEELGGKSFLDSWVPKNQMRMHAQPQGLVVHNLAGNTFNIGLLSLYFGIITKNVNLVKLPHEEPYFAVKLAESIAEVDRKIAKEMAVLYWSGSRSDIFDSLFSSGYVNCVLAWGGLQSIEDIRRRSYHFGIKVVDQGPKVSFSIVSEEVLKDPSVMRELAQKVAMDVAFWNQRACLSPRVIYIQEKSSKSSVTNGSSQKENSGDKSQSLFQGLIDSEVKSTNGTAVSSDGERDILALMQRSLKLLKNEVTDLSPLGFAKILASEMKNLDERFPRSHLTQADVMTTIKKREYFSMKYQFAEEGVVITPRKDELNWTVVYLRNPPSMEEIDMCQDRFIIVTRISNIQEFIHFIRREKLQQYMQTISLYGSDKYVENLAEELSLIGAFRFPRVGEHNYHIIGAPMDGHHMLRELIRWVYIGFPSQKGSVEMGKDALVSFQQEKDMNSNSPNPNE